MDAAGGQVGGAGAGPAHQSLQVDEGVRSSSSAGLSTPPRSEDDGVSASAAHPHLIPAANFGVDVPRSSSTNPSASAAAAAAAAATNAITASTTAPSAPAVNDSAIAAVPTTTGRKPRKKKDDPAANASGATGDEKPKKTRKPREKKDPSAPTQTRRRQKNIEMPDHGLTQVKKEAGQAPQAPQQPGSRQPKITDMVTSSPAQPTRSGSYEASPAQNPNLSYITSTASPASRPASSGQRYDPIRSATMESISAAPASTPVSPPSSRVVGSGNRASASPSIKSLIDPPASSNPIASPAPALSQSRFHSTVVNSTPVSPVALSTMNPSSTPSNDDRNGSAGKPGTSHNHLPVEMDIDRDSLARPAAVKKSDVASTAPSSNAPTPPTKPTRQKEQPPPLPAGSGLLSGTPFGPSTTTNGTAKEANGVDIWLTFPLKGQNNVTINFAREVEKKYGFAALHPRVAAQRERRRQVAAASAALEKAAGLASADDMSVDLSDPDSNLELGGGGAGGDEDGGASGLTADGQPRKRKKRKAEDYDKEDDFIDDTEMAWEQQALMARDGFFVYSGPLVPEGEKPTAERADGTTKRGGRGSRGGRGGTTRGESSSTRGSRGGGRGSRGGATSTRGTTTVRKPRMSKAERAQMEQEKLDRQKMANAAQERSGTAPTAPDALSATAAVEREKMRAGSLPTSQPSAATMPRPA